MYVIDLITGTEPFQKWLDDIDSIASKLDVKFSVYMSELNYEGDARSLVAADARLTCAVSFSLWY